MDYPLDPQDVGLGVWPGQPRLARWALGVVTCGLCGRVQDVWSPGGPHSKPISQSEAGATGRLRALIGAREEEIDRVRS